jgi:hypothetical protein
MNDFPVQKLSELIGSYGTILTEDADRCESLLRANCGDNYKLEVFVLINAIKEGIVQELLKMPPPNISKDAWFAYLSQRLYENYLAFLGLEKQMAEWAVQSWNQILSQWLATNVKTPPKRLSGLNPFDHLRLLWWVLVKPQQIRLYRQLFGETDENRVGKWLVSTLTWWPLLMPTVAAGFETLLPSSDNWPPHAYLWFSMLLVGCWFLTGRLGNVEPDSVMGNVAFGVVFSVVFGVTYALAIALALFVASGFMSKAIGIAFIVAYVVSFYLAYVIAIGIAFSVKDAVTNSLKTGTPYLLARLTFLLLVAAYAFLTWFCFLGGSQLLIIH